MNWTDNRKNGCTDKTSWKAEWRLQQKWKVNGGVHVFGWGMTAASALQPYTSFSKAGIASLLPVSHSI